VGGMLYNDKMVKFPGNFTILKNRTDSKVPVLDVLRLKKITEIAYMIPRRFCFLAYTGRILVFRSFLPVP
jgi:hypothetical protein